MRRTKSIAALVFAAGLTCTTTLRAQDAATTQPSAAQSPATAAMLAKISALEGRINQLQTAEMQTQADVTAAINDLLVDADRRSKMMSVAPMDFTTGYDPSVGFVLQSPDGNFSMHPGASVQFRNMTAHRQSIPAGGGGETASSGTDTQNGFVISRLHFTLDGNVINPNLTYFFQVEDDNGGAGFSLLDAYFQYRISSQSPLALKFGQFKDPLWHEANVLPGNQLAVDRSLVNSFLGNGQDLRVQGVGLIYDEDNFRGQFVLHDGYNSQNTKFFDAGGVGAGVGAGSGVTPTNWGASRAAGVHGHRQPPA